MKLHLLGVALLLSGALSPAANGQAFPGARFEFSAGVTELNGDASGLHRNGTHAQAALALPFHTLLSDELRVDIGYHSIPGKASPAMTIPNAGLVVASADLLKELVRSRFAILYVSAGGGSYRLDQGGGRESHFGLNGGGGIRVPLVGHHLFVEARFHQVFTGEPNGFWPFSVGMRF